MARAIPTQTRARDSYMRIIQAGQKLRKAHGVEGFNMDDVAEGANCSTATVYRYFADKEDLLETAFPGEDFRSFWPA